MPAVANLISRDLPRIRHCPRTIAIRRPSLRIFKAPVSSFHCKEEEKKNASDIHCSPKEQKKVVFITKKTSNQGVPFATTLSQMLQKLLAGKRPNKIKMM